MGLSLTVDTHDERPWASATFTGARHVIRASVTGEASAITGWLAGLGEQELPMAHHLVADIAVATVGAEAIVLEALTVANA